MMVSQTSSEVIMKFEELKDKYRTGYKFQQETGISNVNYENWRKRGYIPIKSQMKIEFLTNGELTADLNHVPAIIK